VLSSSVGRLKTCFFHACNPGAEPWHLGTEPNFHFLVAHPLPQVWTLALVTTIFTNLCFGHHV
jgi:hypothetical protein